MPDKVPNMVLTMPSPKRKVGRPPKPESLRLGSTVFLRVEPELEEALARYAKDHGHTEKAPAIRMAIRDTLKKEGYLK